MHLRAAKDAEEIEGAQSVRAHHRGLRRAVGRPQGRRQRGGRQRKIAYSLAAAAARTPSRTSSSAPTRVTRTARPASARCRRATSWSPTSPRVRRLLGRHDPRRPRRDAVRLGGQGLGGRKEAYDDAVAATKLGNTAKDVDAAQRDDRRGPPGPRRLPARRRPRDRHRGPRAAVLDRHADTPLREGMIFTVEPGIYDSNEAASGSRTTSSSAPTARSCCRITRSSCGSSGSAGPHPAAPACTRARAPRRRRRPRRTPRSPRGT